MQIQELQRAVGCAALEDATAGFYVWAAGEDLTAVGPETGGLVGSAVTGNVAELVYIGPLA